MKTKIKVTPAMARFNCAVARADELSAGYFDRCDVWHLCDWCDARGLYWLSAELEQSARDIGAWPEPFPVQTGCSKPTK